ncbi:hypothetical protein SAMN03097699_2309 [Flavobacteriaceae bacterium MAR_2010_188]|nr:hypothetical protein SAMN03097699_2309 [Flavobacteriaceae bacterium MAR_2010_188]
MKFSYLILTMGFLISCSSNKKAVSAFVPPEPSPIILDHIYFLVPDEGKETIRLMTEAGFVVNPKVFHITGEGKSSRTILLENAYLEILYVDVSVSYTSKEALQQSKNKTWFSGNPVSPFGFAFRRAPGVGDSIPIPNRASPPEPAGSWAKEGSFFNDITDEDDTLSTYLFVIPSYMGHDQWVQKSKEQSPGLFDHSNGVKILTKAMLYGPKNAIPPKEKYITNVPMLKFVRATENYAELEFDYGRQKQRKDLRPELPLILIW